MITAPSIRFRQNKGFRFVQGIGLTLLMAGAAKYIALLPFFNMVGSLVIALLLGMGWRAYAGVAPEWTAGISFAGKKLLRYGIVLLGARLHLHMLVQAGIATAAMAVIHVALTIAVVYLFSRRLRMSRTLGLLTACGTAICGAAAVVALAPQMKAKEEETVVAAATVAILGTGFTLIYTVLYPYMGLSPSGYGLFAGGTLHEVAHAVAATAPVGREAEDAAVVIKLTRVAMLVPVAAAIGLWTQRAKRGHEGGEAAESASSRERLPVPWFIAGFVAVSGLHTLGWLSPGVSQAAVSAAYLLLAMGMAGLGLGVDVAAFRRLGRKPLIAAGAGSVVLAVVGFTLVHVFGLAR